MTRNVLTDTGYRKLDVDIFDPDKFVDIDEQPTAETLTATGADETQIRQLLQSNKNVEALKMALANPIFERKNQVWHIEVYH
jgi:hypothetical protein